MFEITVTEWDEVNDVKQMERQEKQAVVDSKICICTKVKGNNPKTEW